MAPIAFAVLLVLTGLLWKIAPGKTLPSMLSMRGAEGGVAGNAKPAAAFHQNPFPASQCASCHPEHFAEWTRSFHARSLASENFLRIFPQYLDSLGAGAREDPQAAMACFNCHAPLLRDADPGVIRQVNSFVLAKKTSELEGLAVGCLSCHFEGVVLSGPIGNAQNNLLQPSKFSKSYKDASFCAGCHEWTPPGIPCSDVYTDWKKSRAAKQGRTCQACHMPERDGIAPAGGPRKKVHSHLFPGGRSAAMLEQAVGLRLKAAFRKDRLEVQAIVRNLTPHRVPDGCPWNSYAVLEVTVTDETGWEFETIKRVYANFGLDKNGETTGVAWKIVKRSPDSTALQAEEVRVERLSFPVEPRDAKRFTVRAMMRYHHTPAPHDASGEETGATKMAETVLTLPGRRPS
jgi:Cytochrome c554 and c-prime